MGTLNVRARQKCAKCTKTFKSEESRASGLGAAGEPQPGGKPDGGEREGHRDREGDRETDRGRDRHVSSGRGFCWSPPGTGTHSLFSCLLPATYFQTRCFPAQPGG